MRISKKSHCAECLQYANPGQLRQGFGGHQNHSVNLAWESVSRFFFLEDLRRELFRRSPSWMKKFVLPASAPVGIATSPAGFCSSGGILFFTPISHREASWTGVEAGS